MLLTLLCALSAIAEPVDRDAVPDVDQTDVVAVVLCAVAIAEPVDCDAVPDLDQTDAAYCRSVRRGER